MSINSCSINEHTINSLCGRRRYNIIVSLMHGQQQHVNTKVRNLPAAMFKRRIDNEDIFEQAEPVVINKKIEIVVQLNQQEYKSEIELSDLPPVIVSISQISSSNDSHE